MKKLYIGLAIAILIIFANLIWNMHGVDEVGYSALIIEAENCEYILEGTFNFETNSCEWL